MPTFQTHAQARNNALNAALNGVSFEQDVERARVSSTPDALTVIDPRVSTMGLRGVADGSVVL